MMNDTEPGVAIAIGRQRCGDEGSGIPGKYKIGAELISVTLKTFFVLWSDCKYIFISMQPPVSLSFVVMCSSLVATDL